jgi:phage-related baseplate assembly protein
MSEAPAEYFRLVDLTGIPVPDFVETLDFEAIRKSAIDYLVSLDPEYTALLESDPAIKIIEAFSYRELILRQRINDAALGTTITSAEGNDLAVIGALFGVTKLAGETNTAFRRRVQLGLYASSVGGPRQSYELHARSADSAVVDVAVHSPAAGDVAVVVLAYMDVVATTVNDQAKLIGKALFAQPVDPTTARVLATSSSQVLKKVRAALTDDAVRPLTDSVVVQPPTVKTFTIDARLVIYPGPDAATVRASALASLAVYLQSVRRVGYDATLAGIIAALNVGGVQNVIMLSPVADIAATNYELPVCTAVNVVVERVDI